ncbi:ABC transporter permease [Streptomyces sp. ISID311]|uniref:ABC transporter permease n=1 Tax=Streptomyces sp. ISID311 TaxID=2601673 RepID=UPI0011BD32DF|nr:ABC transporter permease [Streptomyces sp. ISID311]TXC99832.1 ABC transporter permease [Streptomyces sp. ISID311]
MTRDTVRYVTGRLVTTAVLLAALSLVVYIGVDLLPGDPTTARLGTNATPDQVAVARERLGLDEPLTQRYTEWVGGLIHGDLGTSANATPVADMLAGRLENTAVLAALTILLLVPLSLALGITLGRRAGSRADGTGSTLLLLTTAVPEFVVAGTLSLMMGAQLGWLPATSLVPAGDSPLSHPDVLVLPVLSLLWVSLAYATRVVRAQTLVASRAPHVEAMRLNGIPERTVLRHGVLPAVLPAAMQIWLISSAGLLGGTVLVEVVFSYPGIGKLLVSSVGTGDLPVVQALAMIMGACTLLATIAADVVGAAVGRTRSA